MIETLSVWILIFLEILLLVWLWHDTRWTKSYIRLLRAVATFESEIQVRMLPINPLRRRFRICLMGADGQQLYTTARRNDRRLQDGLQVLQKLCDLHNLAVKDLGLGQPNYSTSPAVSPRYNVPVGDVAKQPAR